MSLMFNRAKKLQARFFALPSGRKPVRDWILGLGKEDRVIVGKDIQRSNSAGRLECRRAGRGEAAFMKREAIFRMAVLAA
jgi:hypothetical protein